MLERIFLVFDQHGFVKSAKNLPSLASGQIGVKVQVSIPNKWFVRSMPEVVIVLPEPPDVEAIVEFTDTFIGEEDDN